MKEKTAFKIEKAENVAVIIEEFKSYTVSWKCNSGHINFQTVLDIKVSQHDICLTCGKHYEYII